MHQEIGTRYPLTGIRAATSAPQMALLARAVTILQSDDRILAAWLAGSFAVGQGDPFSDLDVHCCVEDTAIEELKTGWKDLLHQITPTVLAVTFPPGRLIGGYSLTPDWTHIDLLFFPRRVFNDSLLVSAKLLPGAKPLFDKTGILLPDAPVPRPPLQGDPYFPEAAIETFFYIFGNLVTVVGRNEPVLATNGVVTIRDTCLVPLFYAERGVHKTGGVKRVNPFLSAEQRHVLEALPPIVATIDGVIEGHFALARLIIPRGRALAERTGVQWPTDLERATVAHVERGIGAAITLNE